MNMAILTGLRYTNYNEIIWDEQHGNANDRGQLLPRQGEKGENTPFTEKVGKRSLNNLGTLQRVPTPGGQGFKFKRVPSFQFFLARRRWKLEALFEA